MVFMWCLKSNELRIFLIVSVVKDFLQSIFIGHALVDKESTIIHHFAGIGGLSPNISYPDFAGGVLFDRIAIEKYVMHTWARVESKLNLRSFEFHENSRRFSFKLHWRCYFQKNISKIFELKAFLVELFKHF